MYMLQKRVIVDVELLMNTSMHVGIMEQGVCTLHVRAWERRRRRVGAAWRRRAKKIPQRLRLCRVRRTA